MSILTSSNTFSVVDTATPALVTITLPVLPAVSAPDGYGRLIHPTLGTYDYDVKPDEWVNIDSDAVIPPVWSSVKTLAGAANVLWSGNIRDVTVEERWKQQLSMPVGQLRTLLAFWMNPVDPAVDYVKWYPNYVTANGYKVLLLTLAVGGSGVVMTDLIHAKTITGANDGWLENPVVLTMKLVAKL